MTSIISALGTAPIHRLSRTWAQVNGKTKDTLEIMRKLMASTKNFAEYRETLHKANPPCVPFLGVYLTDLTFIEDGIPGLIKKSNLINFAKRAKTAEVIRDIQQYQNVPYPLQPVPELQEYVLGNMKNAGDVHEMYDMSLAVEPREREDEKIARYASFPRFVSQSSMSKGSGRSSEQHARSSEIKIASGKQRVDVDELDDSGGRNDGQCDDSRRDSSTIFPIVNFDSDVDLSVSRFSILTAAESPPRRSFSVGRIPFLLSHDPKAANRSAASSLEWKKESLPRRLVRELKDIPPELFVLGTIFPMSFPAVLYTFWPFAVACCLLLTMALLLLSLAADIGLLACCSQFWIPRHVLVRYFEE